MPENPGAVEFRRELGLLDAAVVVAGAIVGVGIFANPSNVARIVGEPILIVAAWIAGGALALLGGFAYAELASRLPVVGGQYVYLARAWHPVVGYLYGIALLFIINGGSIAAVAILFASYLDASFLPLGPVGIRIAAAAVLVTLTAINVVGIRAGKRVNNALMAVKVFGILALVAVAFLGTGSSASRYDVSVLASPSASWMGLLFTALVPIMFAYGGWQNCGSVAGEIRDPVRNLPRANVLGVIVVIVLYVGLNLAYLRVLTPVQMAASPALASDAARTVAGEAGARFVGALILVSALGFLAVIILTAPRLYYAMARDGLFLSRAGTLHPRWHTPVFMLWFQAAVSIALLATNTYDQLLSYVVFADWLFFGLTVGAIFVLRRRQAGVPGLVAMPGHPFTTLLFVAAAAGIVVSCFLAYPMQSLKGSAILLLAAASFPLIAHRPSRAPRREAGE
ncbi:MAG TPA: amino acid permease [Candidatus Polarisedimenticolia bacterium]|nr:amino acid permease [Candidatus Polarisedimenticolia bacterium]